MRAPDITYRFSVPSDTGGPTLELYSRTLTVTASSAEFTATLTGPAKDRALIVTNLNVQAGPGATQSVTRLSLVGSTPAGASVAIETDMPTAVADIRRNLNWQGEVMIGGGGVANVILTASVVFSAGVAANFIVISAYGYVIPRGNIAPY